MKKLVIAAIAATTAFAAPAAAQQLTYPVSGNVGSICGAYRAGSSTIPVDFGELSNTTAAVNVGAASATYRCNSAAGFTRTITSANGGTLDRVGSTGGALNEIAYTISHGGGSGLGFSATQLTTPKINSFGGSGAFLAGQTGSVNFSVNGVQAPLGGNDAPGTTVFAGAYTDTVTISVTAN